MNKKAVTTLKTDAFHSTLDKYFYLAQRANRRDENCVSILPFALPNDVMFKNLMTQLFCLIALNILLKKSKNLNIDINLSTTEHAFTESFEQCIYILL